MKLKENSIVVDATLGLAGHSKEILKLIPKGFLYGFDQDDDSIKIAKENLVKFNNFEIIKSNFEFLKFELEKRKINEVDAILFDLGVSSPQLDNKERGFSFHGDARLDMRMDQESELSAYEVINNYDFHSLVKIFRDYGEEKYAINIARAIEKYRFEKPIVTTMELVEIIKESVPERYKRDHHPARKVFQAIRIEVNRELEVFENALKQALDVIKIGGRVCVITFHSLEDKICKKIFKNVSTIDSALNKLPVIPGKYLPNFKIIGQFFPTDEEISKNKRARSAKLRIIERVK